MRIISNLPDWARSPYVEIDYHHDGLGPTSPEFHNRYLVPALAVLSNMIGRTLTTDDVNLFVSASGIAWVQERLDHMPNNPLEVK